MPCQILKEAHGTLFDRSCAFWLPLIGRWWRLFRVCGQKLTRYGDVADDDGDGEKVDGVDDDDDDDDDDGDGGGEYDDDDDDDDEDDDGDDDDDGDER